MGRESQLGLGRGRGEAVRRTTLGRANTWPTAAGEEGAAAAAEPTVALNLFFNGAVDNTETIRNLKHSDKIKEDVLTMVKLKKDYQECYLNKDKNDCEKISFQIKITT
jgi:hypothetical protein